MFFQFLKIENNSIIVDVQKKEEIIRGDRKSMVSKGSVIETTLASFLR